ncbi:conserved domain-containing protein [Planococcus glaciei]|uniref:DUF2382 domain-containing protein n=1 Tax=Planococcus glaciei TaxID=459472 RepID=UPI000882E0AA|nr:DUF2382 domain-containing protein [Planococcus glaciei]SDG64949.1 conserved domain-containing protein [Planococcus glaciei]
MASNNFMGTFDNETEVLRKIEELKSQGISEDHMYVMAHDKDQISMVRGRTDVDYKATEGGGWMDKFMGFMSGNEPVRQAFNDMGVDGNEADRYYQEVQNGKILLFVDKEIGDSYNNRTGSGSSAYGDPMKNTSSGAGAGAASGIVGADDTSRYTGEDSGMVARDGLTVDTNEANDVNFHSGRNLVDSDETSASSRLDDSESAGVGRKSGTGFGLGSGSSVDDVPSPSRDTGDFTATNESRYGDTDRAGGMGTSGVRDTHSATEDFTDRDRTDRDFLDSDRDRTNSGMLDSDRDRTDKGFMDTDRNRTDSGMLDRDRTDRDFTDTDRDRMDTDHDFADSDEERLRLHEERLQVNKDRVQTGEVNVSKRVVEDQQTIEVPVEREEIYVERRPVNEEVDGDSTIGRDAYQEGDNIHIPLTEERVNVSKTDVVSEEIVVGKRKVQDTEVVKETVRKEEADIDDDSDLGRDDFDRNRTDRR